MQDYEYLVCIGVHKKLKDRVKGAVWAKVYHNELHIKIINGDIKYGFVMCEFSERVLHGISSDIIVSSIISDYKKFIYNYYLR